MRRKNYLLILIITIASCSSDSGRVIIKDMSMVSTINMGATVTYVKIKKVQRDDIVVFISPKSKQQICLRIIGFPGDKIEVIKGKILINEKQYDRVSSSNVIYTVYSKAPTNFSSLRLYDFKPYSENYGMVSVNRKQFEEIRNKKLVDSIYELGFDSSYVYPEIVKTKTSKRFNHYYFGPIQIPNMGDTLFQEDKMLIDRFISFDNSIIIDDDYYFCIGDSFSDAMDSRVIGLIPKKKILGKVTTIKNSNVIRVLKD